MVSGHPHVPEVERQGIQWTFLRHLGRDQTSVHYCYPHLSYTGMTNQNQSKRFFITSSPEENYFLRNLLTIECFSIGFFF